MHSNQLFNPISTLLYDTNNEYFHFFLNYRRETLHVPMARLRVAICQIRRIDATLSEAHWCQALQVHRVRAQLCPKRSSGAAHEATFTQKQIVDWNTCRLNLQDFSTKYKCMHTYRNAKLEKKNIFNVSQQTNTSIFSIRLRFISSSLYLFICFNTIKMFKRLF